MAGKVLFDWSETTQISLSERYYESSYYEEFDGLDQWHLIFESPIGSQEWRATAIAMLRESEFSTFPRPTRHCVFISHRRSDYKVARKAASILCARDIDVWLDILDPTLQNISVTPFRRPRIRQILIALIIEMALINSTHVLALLTNQTQGSMWVPYEYGRIKQGKVTGPEAAMLKLDPVYLPEYALLGPVFKSLRDLRRWPPGSP